MLHPFSLGENPLQGEFYHGTDTMNSLELYKMWSASPSNTDGVEGDTERQMGPAEPRISPWK